MDNLKRLSFSSVKGLYPENEVMPVEGTQHYLSRSDNKLRANKQLIFKIDGIEGLENVRFFLMWYPLFYHSPLHLFYFLDWMVLRG